MASIEKEEEKEEQIKLSSNEETKDLLSGISIEQLEIILNARKQAEEERFDLPRNQIIPPRKSKRKQPKENVHAPVPMQVSEKPKSNRRINFSFWISIFSIGLVCSLAWNYRVFLPQQPREEFAFLPFVPNPPSEACLFINQDFYQSNRESADIVRSMEKHMNDYPDMIAISAFRIGRPYCVMMLRNINNQTEIFNNMRITRFDTQSSANVPHASFRCINEPKYIERSNEIWVVYQDPSSFHLIEAKFTGEIAHFVQAEYAYQNGFDVCDFSDKGVKTLRELLNKK